ncbi:MAG: superoxide dismutase [Bacteroidetes bacterium]|nr:superoxide dismutase [Bacteroidota bacterium]
MENSSSNSRRKFIKNTAAGTAAVTIGLTSMASMLESFGKAQAQTQTSLSFDIGFDQSPLPYKYDALEDIIDATTMEIHYTKHAAAYSKNLKEAATAEGIAGNRTVESVLAEVSKYSAKLRNNAGGHFNHEMFWQCMRPKSVNNKPSGKLGDAITATFGSFDSFKKVFSDAAKNRFGSGWAWLYKDANGGLKVGSTPNQDNPLMNVAEFHGNPLLGIDVWEHAYYLKYQNKRADYIEGWWNLVNWDYVQQRFNM